MTTTRWRRYGHWAAHLFENDRQLCSTQHGHYKGHAERGLLGPAEPSTLGAEDLAAGGVPYGRVCARCLKLFHAASSEA